MIRLPGATRRTPIVLGLGLLGLTVLGPLAWSLGRPGGDPWPIRAVIRPPAGSRPASFTPDGRSFLTWSGTTARAWDPATGRAQDLPFGQALFRRSDAADGRSYVGVAGDDFAASAVVWVDAATGAVRARFPVRGWQVFRPALAADGRTIRAYLGDRRHLKEVATWDVATGAEATRPIVGPEPGGIPRNMRPLESAADGPVWPYHDAVAGGVRLWDVEAGRAVGGLFRDPAAPLGPGPRPDARFTADGRSLVVVAPDGRAELWDVAATRLVRAFRIHADPVVLQDLAIAPDGRTLAATGCPSLQPTSPLSYARILVARLGAGPARSDWETVVVDLADGRTVARLPGSILPRFAPDGRSIATLESDETFAIRDAPRPAGR